MSVVSKNPFDLLGDDGDESPAPKAAPKAAPAAEAKPKREVPGAKTSTPSTGAASGNAQRGARYPSRGGPRNVYKGDRSPVQENVPEGTETGVFDGERAPPSRKSNHTRDAHTKGPRGSRPAKTTSGGHTSSRNNVGGARTPAQGGERRQFERRSGALPDSQKKVDQGWGANEGSAELTAEVEGQTDAISEEKAAAAADAWGPDATDAAAAGTADAAAPAEEQEPEEVQKSLTEYLAEKAQAGLEGILGKKEGRTVTAEALEGAKFAREGIDEFFHGKEKTASNKTKAPKKEKVYIAFDGQFAKPAGEREQRGDRREGGRDGNRGGARGGARGGRGQGPRGGAGGARPQGQGQRGPRSQAIDANDTSAFPALGA